MAAQPPFNPFPAIPRLPKALADQINEIGDDICRWFNPDMDYDSRATKGMPLGTLDEHILYLGAYVIFALLAFLYYSSKSAPAAPEKKGRKGSVATENFGATDAKGNAEVSVATKFAKEPILVVQAVYNAVQVALCAYMIVGTVQEYQAQGYTFICNAFRPEQTGMATMLWVFYVSKVLDFFDTIFMVVRGKWKQFSFLHVYHHTSIFFIYWINLNVGYDGDIYYTVVLNAFIHFMMYFYYFLRTFNVKVPVAMKMFVTNSQLLQFITMMSQAVYLLAFGCAFPYRVTTFYLFYIFSLFLLFSDFKKKEYTPKDKKSK